MVKNLLTLNDLNKEEIKQIINKSIEIKKDIGKYSTVLKDKTLLMLFEKPSLRTRVSFEVGMTQLGGHAIFYSVKDSPLGEKETIEDLARTSSRYVDIIMARTFEHDSVVKLSENASVPVINALTNFSHPCQILGDMQTIQEKKGSLDIKLAYFGDSNNNVTHSLMYAAHMLGFEMNVACPEGKEYSPQEKVVSETKVKVLHNAEEAAKDADVIYTDSWMSYHIPKEKEPERVKIFKPFQVTQELMAKAKSDAIFMNCLPARRGYEQTAEVIDGKQSVVFDQAENRLHIQKAIMLFLLGKL